MAFRLYIPLKSSSWRFTMSLSERSIAVMFDVMFPGTNFNCWCWQLYISPVEPHTSNDLVIMHFVCTSYNSRTGIKPVVKRNSHAYQFPFVEDNVKWCNEYGKRSIGNFISVNKLCK